jgi:hypothetical protein
MAGELATMVTICLAGRSTGLVRSTVRSPPEDARDHASKGLLSADPKRSACDSALAGLFKPIIDCQGVTRWVIIVDPSLCGPAPAGPPGTPGEHTRRKRR